MDDESWLWGANNSADSLDSQGLQHGGRPKKIKVAGVEHDVAPLAPVERASENYMKFIGRPGQHVLEDYPQFDEGRARKIAQAYDEMEHAPTDPRVKRAYDAMIEETLGQYNHLKDAGYDFQFIKPGEADPYAQSPALGYLDLRDRGRLSVFPTDAGFGTLGELDVSSNPLLKRVGKIGDLPNATANDAFRIVHDMYGHFGPGNPFFRHKGEERAWQHHSRMYSPEAVPAMTSETRGQNSWLNFGPYGDRNRSASSADTVYADQKSGLMPEWTHDYAGGGRARHIEWRDDFDTMFGGEARKAGDLVRRHTERTGKEGASFGNEFFHTPLIRGQRTSVDLNAGPRAFSEFSHQMEQQELPYFSVHAHPLVTAGPKDLSAHEASNIMSNGNMLGGGFFPSAPDLGFSKPLHSLMIESAGLPNNRLAVDGANVADLADGRRLLGSIWEKTQMGEPTVKAKGYSDFMRSHDLWPQDPLPIDLLVNDALAARGVPMQLDKRAASGTLGGKSMPAMDILPAFKSFLQKQDAYPFAEGGRA